MKTNRKLTALEDATLRTLVSCADESEGWLDLTRVCSRVGRHLSDVRQAVARLERYGVIEITDTSAQTDRWVRVIFPGDEE
ncbi:MAG: hypothetical protein QNJ98_18875 [Planctomycetota bacterium]|nr:hypothetical protein [Planctomycetota bacterium]